MDEAAVLALVLEADLAVHEREDRVVLAHADIDARVEAGAALADDDGTGGAELAAEDLGAETLGMGVAAVAGGADAFFMSQGSPLLRP